MEYNRAKQIVHMERNHRNGFRRPPYHLYQKAVITILAHKKKSPIGRLQLLWYKIRYYFTKKSA